MANSLLTSLYTLYYCAAPTVTVSSALCLFHHCCVILLFYCTLLSLPFSTLTSSLHHIVLSQQLPLTAPSPSSSFLFPSPHLIIQGYIIFVLLLLEHTPSTHNSPPPSRSLSANRVSLLAGSLEEVRRVMGLSNSPTRRQAYTAYVCVFCVCHRTHLQASVCMFVRVC